MMDIIMPVFFATIVDADDGFLTLVNGIIWPRPQNCGFFYVKFIKI